MLLLECMQGLAAYDEQTQYETIYLGKTICKDAAWWEAGQTIAENHENTGPSCQ